MRLDVREDVGSQSRVVNLDEPSYLAQSRGSLEIILSEDTLAQTIEVVAAYVANHKIRPDDVPGFITATHAAVLALDMPETTAALEPRRKISRPRIRRASR